MSDNSYMVYTSGCGYKEFFDDLNEAIEHAIQLVDEGEMEELYIGDDCGCRGVVDEYGFREEHDWY